MFLLTYFAKKDRLSFVSPLSLANFSCSILWTNAAVSGCGPISIGWTRTLDLNPTAEFKGSKFSFIELESFSD